MADSPGSGSISSMHCEMHSDRVGTPSKLGTRDSFYGRRKGKALRAGQAQRVATLLPRLAVPIGVPPPVRLETLFPNEIDDVCLEIGFGGGEHLAHEAAQSPTTGFIGVEPFLNGIAKLLGVVESGQLRNIRIHDGDAGPLLDWLPPSSLRRIDLLYPDPWPKRRHWKRRFVNDANLARMARVLVSGGQFRFASDIESYVDWTLQHVHRSDHLVWNARVAEDWRRPWPGWPSSRYEAKALREGRTPAYLVFSRL